MANEAIRLTFSEDGEFLQLSRMDPAVLLTWILGGDHDAPIDTSIFEATPLNLNPRKSQFSRASPRCSPGKPLNPR